jgi:hypothetical protein
VAAVLALVGAVAVLDDDQSVDTTPATMPVPVPRTIVSGSGCAFGITGDPVVMQSGPVDPRAPRFDTEEGQGVAHTLLDSQVIEVRVPGFELTEPEGWRMEDLELPRGSAKVWLDGPASGELNKPFVQVRYFPATEVPCGSFTVTVDGGTEAENRQTAIDFAARILLPAELGDLAPSGGDQGAVPGRGEPSALPEPGDPPADPAAAEAQIRAAFIGIFDASHTREERAQFSERPEVWSDANQELVEGPFGSSVADQRAEVDEVVFTSPTHAAVRFQLIASDPIVPRDHIGDAVLVDGRWLVAISTTCRMVEIAAVQCDLSP